MGDFGSLFSVSALEQYDCPQSQRQQASVSRSTKGGLDSPLYAEEFVGKAEDWNENSPDIVKQQRVYSTATVHHHCNLALAHSGLAILL